MNSVLLHAITTLSLIYFRKDSQLKRFGTHKIKGKNVLIFGAGLPKTLYNAFSNQANRILPFNVLPFYLVGLSGD